MRPIPYARHTLAVAAAMTALTAACSETSQQDNAADAGPDGTSDVVDATPDASVSDADGDASPAPDATADVAPDAPAACADSGETMLWVLHTVRFARMEGNVVQGLDIDGRTSDVRDPGGCRIADGVSPDGRAGIDNNFATLLPAIEQIGGDAIEGLIQSAINAGELLLFLQLRGVDDLTNDACVEVTLGRAAGTPTIGTDRRIEPWQTFDYHPELAPTLVGDFAIVDGRLQAGETNFQLPLNILGTEIDFNTTSASVVAEHLDRESVAGFLAASISLDEVIELADRVVTDQNTVAGVIRDLAPTFADLFPDEDGNCQGISVALLVEGVPAFFYPDATPAP